MNVDFTNTFRDAKGLIKTWKQRYAPQEYPYKVVLNVFYRKFTIERMWSRVINQSHPTWQQAYGYNMEKYAEVAQSEIVPVLEAGIKANNPVGMIRFSDFQSNIQSAASGDKDAIRRIEYSYFLNRILDELVILWISRVNAGESKMKAITYITGAEIAEMPIDNYATIEQLFDRLGAESELKTLFFKEMSGQV